MKKVLLLSSLFIVALGLNSLAMAYEPFEAGLWADIKSPSSEAPNTGLGSKVGKATCKSFVGLVKLGDCSLKTAMKNGHITRVNGADWEKSWKLLYGTKTLVVYGN